MDVVNSVFLLQKQALKSIHCEVILGGFEYHKLNVSEVHCIEISYKLKQT